VALGQICSDTTVEFISCNSLEYDTIIWNIILWLMDD
jgi:hypothetical protein